MNDIVDMTNYEDLKSCDPREVVARVNCQFDETLNQYSLNIWGHDYTVDLNACEIQATDMGQKLYKDLMDLFVLYVLMKSKDIPPSGQWVSEKDIPGGEGFFRGPHLIPTDQLTKRFGDDLALFKQVCQDAGGNPLDLGDASFSFQITPAIPVAVLYWQGDEDFPSEAKLLFDQTIRDHLPLDIIYCLAVGVCSRLGKTTAP